MRKTASYYTNVIVRRLDNPELKAAARACYDPYPRPNPKSHKIFAGERKCFWVTTFTLCKETIHLVGFKKERMRKSDSVARLLESENFFAVVYKGEAHNTHATGGDGELMINALKKRMLPEIYCLLYGQEEV